MRESFHGARARRIAGLICASFISLMLTSCSGGEDRESVFLFIINGYAGTDSIDLYGPTGPVVQGLGFGERTETAIEVDRSLGTEFTLVINGTPQPIEMQYELFELYPQETATIFLKKRSGDAEAAVSVYRHVQTIDPACAVTFENGLSTGSEYLTAGSFSWAPEFKLNDIRAANIYADEEQLPVITECGPLPTPAPAPIPRTALHQTIVGDANNPDDGDPWFFLAECESEVFENSVCAVWGVLEDQSVVAPPPTFEYFECLAGAITIKQPETMDGALPFPPADAQVQCPEGDLTWDDVQVDPMGVTECQALREYTTEILEPSENQETYSLVLYNDPRMGSGSGLFDIDEDSCDMTFRISTVGLQTVFGPDSSRERCSSEGFHGCGDFVVSNLQVPIGAEHFFVMFGRPVNPLVWQWNSSENFVDLREFPYLNSQNDRIGTDYDSEPRD